jgi:hypothetical protein
MAAENHLPLPEFPHDSKFRIWGDIAGATEKAIKSLHRIFNECLHDYAVDGIKENDFPPPDLFIGPVADFAERAFDAYAAELVLMRLKPDEFSDLLHFGLVTYLFDWIVPTLTPKQLDGSPLCWGSSELRELTNKAWETYDHPDHYYRYDLIQQAVRRLEDYRIENSSLDWSKISDALIRERYANRNGGARSRLITTMHKRWRLREVYWIAEYCRRESAEPLEVAQKHVAESIPAPAGKGKLRASGPRSRDEYSVQLESKIREFKDAGDKQVDMCRRLDQQGFKPPAGVRWRHLTWLKAFHDPKYGPSVKKYLSKASTHQLPVTR